MLFVRRGFIQVRPHAEEIQREGETRTLRDMATIRAIYENGVFRPLDPVRLPEGCRVEICSLRADRFHRKLQAAFDQVDRGEVSDLDMDALLAEAHRHYFQRLRSQT